MTNKEAIEILEILKANYSDACLERLRQACDMAIDALDKDKDVVSKDGDTISRQAAIDTVRKCPVKEVTPAYILIDKAEVMAGLMKVPSAQPEQKWIPVSRDLPEPRWKDVLVTREYKGADDGNKDKRYVEVASMCGDEWVSYSDEYKIHPKNHKVIAWMELPKPYGGEPEC